MGLFSKKDGYDARQRELEEEVETAADRIIFLGKSVIVLYREV